MKARVKATGEIIEVIRSTGVLDENSDRIFPWYEVETLDSHSDDYWTRLEHTYAGMALQTMLATLYNPKYHKELMACYTEVDAEEVARLSKYYAHALVEMYKKEK